MTKADEAIREHLAGASRAEVAAKYGVNPSTVGRWMRERGVKLDPEDVRRRKSAGAKKRRDSGNNRCEPGCTCKRHGRSTSVVLGRKICNSPHHEGPRWLLLHYFDVSRRDAEGNAIGWQYRCKTCDRITQRISKGIKKRGKPYEARRRRRNREELNKHRREQHALKMKTDREYREKRREYARIWAEAKRREAGVEPRNLSRPTPGHSTRLYAEPIAEWVRQNLPRYQNEPGRMASKCRVDEATIRRLRDNEVRHISEDLADRILTHEGSTDLWMVYPHLYA